MRAMLNRSGSGVPMNASGSEAAALQGSERDACAKGSDGNTQLVRVLGTALESCGSIPNISVPNSTYGEGVCVPP